MYRHSILTISDLQKNFVVWDFCRTFVKYINTF